MRRGNGGADTFFDDDDRYHFYLLLQQCEALFVGEALCQANQEPRVRPKLDHGLRAVRDIFDVSDVELHGSGQSVYISEVRAFWAWAVYEPSDAALAVKIEIQ